jgi:hypothetical protein
MSMPFEIANKDGLDIVVAGFELMNERLDILTKSVENLHDKVTSANRSIDNVREEILQRIDEQYYSPMDKK